VELENQRLSAELKETLSAKDDSLITSMQDTDCNKALELADIRISSLEKQVYFSGKYSYNTFNHEVLNV